MYWWCWWRWWWVRTGWASQTSMWKCCGVLKDKHQKVSSNRQPSTYTCRGGGSAFNQHQSRDTETDGYCNTCDGSPGRPGALPRNVIFYRWICSTQYFTILFWVWVRRGIARINSQRYTNIWEACGFYVGGEERQPVGMGSHHCSHKEATTAPIAIIPDCYITAQNENFLRLNLKSYSQF